MPNHGTQIKSTKKMTKKSLISAIAVLAISMLSHTAKAQTQPDATYMYAQRDTCNLYLDIYEPVDSMAITANGTEKPSIIFMFGGGFIYGSRDNESYNKWFTDMKNEGYRIISIDYRLEEGRSSSGKLPGQGNTHGSRRPVLGDKLHN